MEKMDGVCMTGSYWHVRWRFFPEGVEGWIQVSWSTVAWHVEYLWGETKNRPSRDGSYTAGVDFELIDDGKTVRSFSFDDREEALKMIKKWQAFL